MKLTPFTDVQQSRLGWHIWEEEKSKVEGMGGSIKIF